jgi:hypothetical protein
MRLISSSVNARRFDSAVDLSSLTRTAGLTASNSCRTASPRQIRSTFTPKFAVERKFLGCSSPSIVGMSSETVG